MVYEYKKIENNEDMKKLVDGQYWWCYDPTDEDTTVMVCAIKQPTNHTCGGFWCGPIPTPQQLNDAQKFSFAFLEVQTNLVSVQALSQALADEVSILQEVIKAKNVEHYKEQTEDNPAIRAERGANEKCDKCKKELLLDTERMVLQDADGEKVWCIECCKEAGALIEHGDLEPENTVQFGKPGACDECKGTFSQTEEQIGTLNDDKKLCRNCFDGSRNKV